MTASLTAAWYRRTTDKQMTGLRVVTLRPLTNSNGTIAAGTIMTITRKFDGLSLRADKCSCCEFAPTISRVGPNSVALAQVPVFSPAATDTSQMLNGPEYFG